MENKTALFKKLVKVLGASEKVTKSGTNTHQHYKYIMESDLLEVIRPELIKEGIFIFTSSKVTDVKELQVNQKTNILTTVETTHTFVDSLSGESFAVTSVGQGIDNTDKSVFKALTGASKYFFLKNFMLSGDDDPENDGETPVKQKPAQPQQQLTSPTPSKPTQEVAPSQPKPAAKTTTSSFAPKTTGFSKPATFSKPKAETQPAQVPTKQTVQDSDDF